MYLIIDPLKVVVVAAVKTLLLKGEVEVADELVSAYEPSKYVL